ncbi:MAG: Ig-like domain-containing protein [Microgenomates group bacterium]
MAYKYLESSLPLKKSPKETYTNHFQHILDAEFKNSSDWYTIQEETYQGSGEFQNVDVRVTKAIAMKTSGNVGDDFKILSFQSMEHQSPPGTMYFFDDNYWITVNSEEIKNLAASCTIRRCNNVLRWKDPTTGRVYNEKCIIDYLIKETRDYSTAGSSLVQPSGFIEVFCQSNDRTNLIKQNQRFLFGNTNNWVSYKIQGGGLNNFINLKTLDNNSNGIIRLSMLVVQVNAELDDIVNGIADSLESVYTLTLDYSTLSLNIGDALTFTPTIKKNDETISSTVLWTSSDTRYATVNSSGKVTAIANGMAYITATLEDAPEVTATCDITVSATPVSNKKVVVSPNVNYVYEGATQIFSCYLYIDDTVQADAFVFEIDGAVPPGNFTFTVIDDNHFSIKNIKKYLDENLVVTSTSGTNVKTSPITLLGGW